MNAAVLEFLKDQPTLLLDILVQKDKDKDKDNNTIEKYFGKDENSGQIFYYDKIDLKIESVIKRSIDLLCKGRFIEDDLLDDSLPESILADIHMKTGHYRTICLLLSLKWFFLKEYEKNVPQLNDIELGEHNLYYSMQLLLIQAVRFSQIEWDNNRFCYEYYSSKSAKSYLSSFFDNHDKDDKIKNKKIIILIIEQVIRWHTLMGQYLMGSSFFLYS